MEFKELQALNDLIWKYLRFEINTGGIQITANEKAIYLRPSNHSMRKMEQFIKILPSKFDHYVNLDGKYIFAPVETPEQKVNFAEAKSAAIGMVLLEHKKESLKLMETFSESLKELRDLKKEVGVN